MLYKILKSVRTTSYPKRRKFGLRYFDIAKLKTWGRQLRRLKLLRNWSCINGQLLPALLYHEAAVGIKRRLRRKAMVPLALWLGHNRKPSQQRKTRFIDYSDEEVDLLFGFRSVSQLERLKHHFSFPDEVILPSRHRFSGEEVMMIGLFRLRNPTSLRHCEREFHRDGSSISRCFRFFVDFFKVHWLYLIEDNVDTWRDLLPECTEKIRAKAEAHLKVKLGNPTLRVPTIQESLEHGFRVFAFIDATTVSIDRPGGGPVHPGGPGAARHDNQEQQVFYSGHKKHHGLKMQTCTLPNGITYHALEPTSSRPHDSSILQDSHCLDRFLQSQQQAAWYQAFGGRPLMIHGDSAYLLDPVHPVLQSGGLKFLRITEEFNYGGLKRVFPVLDYKHFWRVKQSQVVSILSVMLLLKNAHVCLNGDEVSAYYEMHPPSLQEYTSQGPRIP